MSDYGKVCCEHNVKLRLDGLCKKCSEIKPYMVFSWEKGGYFWGPGHPMDGQRVVFKK